LTDFTNFVLVRLVGAGHHAGGAFGTGRRTRPPGRLGGGLYGGPSIFSPWTRGNGHERFVTLVVEGRGTLQLEVASCRVGRWTLQLAVG